MTGEFYAIQRDDGAFLPQMKRRKGFTSTEPVDMEERPPRLFMREQDAKTALTWWLRGATHVSLGRPNSIFGDEDWVEDWDTTEIPDRKAAGMKVVHVRVEVAE